MKRVAMLPLLAVVLVAVGCGTPPPQWWKPPAVQSTVVSTTEIVAGSSFTVAVTATDDHSVAHMGFLFYDASMSMALHVPCEVAPWTPGPVVTVEATCTMPAVAPNGAWTLRVEATDAEFSGGGEGACGCGASHTALTVTGGTEDRQHPEVSDAVFSPNPVPVGTSFTATFRASDEHPGNWDEPLGIAYYPLGSTTVFCSQTSHTVLSPTEHEWVFTCPAPTTPGDLLLMGTVQDEIGYSGYVWNHFDVVAP